MKISKITLLKLGVLACFVVGYRFAAHGKSLNDRASLYIGYVAFAAAILFSLSVIWIGWSRR